AMLYRAVPPQYLNDAYIHAICDRLCHDIPSARFAGFQSATTKGKRKMKYQVMSSDILKLVGSQAAELEVKTIFVPINFSNAHWCSIVVDTHSKTIHCYDPLNQKEFTSAVEVLAMSLKTKVLPAFRIEVDNDPLQFELISCGVYVCWMFI
ncbi:hypothetical protein PHYSODRAFT_382010, partial [Phytophthora sojae]